MIRKGLAMAIRYNRLWKKLIDENMMKIDLREKAGITTNALAKLGKNEHVNTQVLEKYVMYCIAIYRILWNLFQTRKGKKNNMAKKKTVEKALNIDSILFNCRDYLRAARNSGSFLKKGYDAYTCILKIYW